MPGPLQVQCMGSPHCRCHTAVPQQLGGGPRSLYSVQPEFGKSRSFKMGIELANHWKLSVTPFISALGFNLQTLNPKTQNPATLPSWAWSWLLTGY